MDPHITDNVTKPSQVPWTGNLPTKCFALKIVSTRFLLVCFLSLKESPCETKNKSFISVQKLFLFPIKSNFSILGIRTLSRHQMPKYKTRNTFCWMTWNVNTICKLNLGSLFKITKEKKLSKNSIKTAN